jgi:hypothetical protein
MDAAAVDEGQPELVTRLPQRVLDAGLSHVGHPEGVTARHPTRNESQAAVPAGGRTVVRWHAS